MIPALHNIDGVLMHLVHQAMGFVDATRPVTGKVEFERFRLADTAEWMITDVSYKCFDLLRNAGIMAFPVCHVFIGGRSKTNLQFLEGSAIKA